MTNQIISLGMETGPKNDYDDNDVDTCECGVWRRKHVKRLWSRW